MAHSKDLDLPVALCGCLCDLALFSQFVICCSNFWVEDFFIIFVFSRQYVILFSFLSKKFLSFFFHFLRKLTLDSLDGSLGTRKREYSIN